MARNSSISFGFTSLRGATRRLVLVNAACFFAVAAAQWLLPAVARALLPHLVLQPAAVMHGEVWQLVTYSFLNLGLLSAVFALMTMWSMGTLLEGTFSSRWVMELYFVSVIGGGALAVLLSYAHLPGLGPLGMAAGAWSGVFGWMIAITVFFGEQEFLFMFVLRMKAKYMVAVYFLIVLAMFLRGGQMLDALVQLTAAGCAYGYVKRAPRKGLGSGFSESYYGVRNNYYRWKRRRAAKKFTVYMRKQNREVNFDASGRYIEPEDVRDPNDKRWMN